MPPSSSVGAGRSRSMCSSTHCVGRPSVNSRGVMLFRTSPVNITTERPALRRSVIGSAFYPHGNPRPLSELLNPHTPASNSSTPRPAAAAATNSSSNTPGITAKLHPAAAAIAAADARRAAASAAGPLPRPMPYGMPRGTPLAHNTLSAVATAPGPAAAAAPHPFTAAPLYEAFEPGDSGFFSPTTAEIVTSSSGSVMVQVCAHFNGQPGDKVLVCGATRVMGNWEPDAAPSLTWSEGDVWTATLELPAGTHEFKSVAIKPIGPPVWEPGNNRRVSVPRGGSLASSSGDEHDGGLGLHDGDGGDGHPDAQLVETSGGTTMVKLTTTYTAAFGEYLKVVGDCPELGSWDAGAAPALTWGEGDVWTATLELPAGEHEFKYVVVRQDGRLEWEPGENRRIHVPLPGLAAALAAAKKVAAAEEAVAAANGSGKPPAAGRKLSAAEVYQRQEAEQRLELWQENLPQYKQQQQQSDQALMPTNGRTGSSSGAVTPTAKPVPADWREVKFSTKFAAEFGTFLKVVGGPDQLGAWDVDAAPPLQWSEGDMWSITLLLPPGTHQFKLVVVNPSGTSEWEAGPNRTFEVMPALTTAEQAAGVLQAECLYGATHATGSIWASLEEDEEHLDQHARAAAEAAAAVVEMHRQQQQQEQQQQLEQQMQPEDWYQQQQELAEKAAAAVAAAEAAAQQQMELSAEAAAAAAEEVVPAKPAKPLQPLDAVVKVFKDRFAASSAATSPAASPTASMEEEQQLLPEPVTQQQQDVKQQQQQQPAQQQPEVQQIPQQPEEPQEQQQQPVGDRFAAIIAARRQQQQQQQSAILFVDKQQPQTQQQSDKPQEQTPVEQQRKPSQKPSSSSGGGNWFDEALASTRGRQQQPQQQQQQQRAPTPPWELQPDESASTGLPPLSTDDSSSGQQQLQQPERFASQIKQIRSRPGSPPPRAAAAVPPAADFRVRPPWEQTDDHTPDTSTSRTDAEQKQAKPTTTSEAPARSQQQQAAHTPQQKPPSSWQSTKDEQPAVSSSSSSSWRTNWRSQSQPADNTPAAPSPADDSSGAPGGRFAAYCAQQDTKPAPASSSSSEGRPASPSWRAPSTPVQQAADAPATRSSTQSAASTDAKPAASSSSSDRWAGYSWRSSSPVQPDSSSSSTEATSSSSTPSSSSSSVSSESSSDSRFSKYTSGASWRSSAPQPTQKQPEQQQQQQQQAPRSSWRSSPQQQQQQQQQREQQQSQPKQSQQPASQESASGGRFANYIQGRAEGSSSSSSCQPSSWSAAEASGVGGDYLYQLGQSDYNTNVDAGQNVAMIDSLFTGNVLGHKTDIADGSLRGWEVRTLNNIIGDYYIAPKFMDRVAMHITKNYLCDVGALSTTAKVPLILGIWGPKGCGKTFQTELAFKQLGVEPVVLSAGELESETAGQPGRLIRERYRKAAELSKTRGKLSCLLINDLDAGIGRFGNTQVTVNNQIVIGTLMNICDNPNRVSIGAGWRENDEIRRVPIIVTGNDFSTLYAPLIRDGRMEKFYWQPEREDIVNIVFQMYRDDGLSRRDIESLVDTFSHQALDFFGALRAATYDGQIRDWMASVAGAPLYAADESRVKEVNKRLLSQTGVPEFEPLPLTLDMLLAEGRRLVAQQEAVNNSKLGELYMKGVVWGEAGADAWSSSEVDD